MEKFKKFIKDENGLETVEYAIIAGLIVVGTIVTITAIGGKVATVFTSLNTADPGILINLLPPPKEILGGDSDTS